MHTSVLSPEEKAFAINRDQSRYGTFAEIGAGQEVARWFFKVGGAAGTIAKTMSAYDMVVSDAIYGEAPRYVSRDRLGNMLKHEYDLLMERLAEVRGDHTLFFVYANTVKARSYQGSGHCNGWMGVKLQYKPHEAPNQIIIHVWMHDPSNIDQQEAIGIVGVNLIHGAIYQQDPHSLVRSLLDGLTTQRIEIDMIEFSGPDFEHIDNREMNLELVRHRLTHSVIFAPDRSVHQASEVLYRRPVLVNRGRFKPVTSVNLDMMNIARARFIEEIGDESSNPIEIMEISIQNLSDSSSFDAKDYLARIDLLNSVGKSVMVSNRSEFYKLADHLRRNTNERIGLVLGVPLFRELFDERYYQNLDGGLLEGIGRLFKRDLQLFVYPVLAPSMNEVITASTMQINPNLEHLLAHLCHSDSIVELKTEHPVELGSTSNKITRLIEEKDASWEKLVPTEVAERIKKNRYFGYREREETNNPSLEALEE